MSPRYSQHVSGTSNLYWATCVRQHICIRIQVARPGNIVQRQIIPDSGCKVAEGSFAKFSREPWTIKKLVS